MAGERAGVRGCAHRFLSDEVLMHQNRMRADADGDADEDTGPDEQRDHVARD